MDEVKTERDLTLSEAFRTPQFWAIYVMACLGVFQGYYTVNVYKAYGQTVPTIEDDCYLTCVGSLASLLGTLRFLWSAAMDYKGATFKRVYGTLTMIQIILGFTIQYAANNKSAYMTWVCLIMFTESGHFTVIPNALKKIYGE